MNKVGGIGLSILGMIGILIVGLMLTNFLMSEVTTFRTSMNCSDTENIHDGNKILCLIGDITVPYWIYLILALGIGAITARWVF